MLVISLIQHAVFSASIRKLDVNQNFVPSRKLSDTEIDVLLRAAFKNLETLCNIYDTGHPGIAYLIASEIHKLLVESERTRRMRGDLEFCTPALIFNEENILPENILIYSQLQIRTGEESPAYIEYVPRFTDKDCAERRICFRDWWNREPIFYDGVVKIENGRMQIPENYREYLPFKKRRKITRREFITQFRNKFRAHLDVEIPKIIAQLRAHDTFGLTIVVDLDGAQLSTLDGTLPIMIGPDLASIRQIAHEVLLAFKTIEKDML
jgi:hypothetical protein